MTTLRREAIQKAESILIPAYSDNPPTEESIEYAKQQAERVVDALLELRGFSFLKQTDEDKAEYNVLFRGDVHEFPEPLWLIAEHLRDVWMFTLPHKSKRGEKKSQFGFWILSMDELKSICGEFGVKALQHVRDDFVAYMQSHGGGAPYTVAGPQSLLNVTRAKVAQMRTGIESQAEYRPSRISA